MDERDLRNRLREPFGPMQPGLRGTLLRMVQWALTILTVMLAWPAVIMVVTVLLPTGGGFRGSMEDWLAAAIWLTGAATLLLTGLVNSQSIRTCEMLDVPCIVFVRGKDPQPDAIEKAIDIGLPALKTPYTMFEVCGRLYQAGLRPVNIGEDA